MSDEAPFVLLALDLLLQWPRRLVCQSCLDTRHLDPCTPSFLGRDSVGIGQSVRAPALFFLAVGTWGSLPGGLGLRG